MPMTIISKSLLIGLLILTSTQSALAVDVQREDVRKFIDSMVENHSYDRTSLMNALQAAKSRQSILDAISNPAERTLDWTAYRNIFLARKRVAAGADFWREHRGELRRISEETGVSREILVGIIGVDVFWP